MILYVEHKTIYVDEDQPFLAKFKLHITFIKNIIYKKKLQPELMS